MKEVKELKGYYGYVKIDEQGNAVQAENVENKEEWAKVIFSNLKKGMKKLRN